MVRPRAILWAAALAKLLACRGDDDGAPADAGVDAVPADADPGAHPGEVWIATWNLQLFPKSGQTISKMTTLLGERAFDLVAVQEIDDNAAFGQLDQALGAYTAIIADDPFGDTRVGIMYRQATVTVISTETLFTNDQYAFPRPPLLVHASAQGIDFKVMVLHLKALGDADSQARRRDAIVKLEAWFDTELLAGGELDFVVLGDWNDKLTDVGADNVFTPLLGQPARFRFLTLPLAEREDQDGGTYIPFESFIDHVMITSDFEVEYGMGETSVIKLDLGDPTYESTVSDHRPVLVKMRPGL